MKAFIQKIREQNPFTGFSRRCLIIAPGNRYIKVLLAEKALGKVRVLHALSIDLEEEGLLTPEEARRHVSRVISELDDAPVTLVIPQMASISQVMDLRQRRGAWNVKRLIHAQTSNLSGLSDEPILYDFRSLSPFAEHGNPFWVTIARETEVEEQLLRLGTDGDRIAGVTTPANALISSFLSLYPAEKSAVLVEVGAAGTTLVIVENRQGVFATNLGIGCDSFSEAVAKDTNSSIQVAEGLKRQENLFEREGDPLMHLAEEVSHWHAQVAQVVTEWTRENERSAEDIAFFPWWLSGTAVLQPGLRTHLEQVTGRQINVWPNLDSEGKEVSLNNYAVVYGAALSALGKTFSAANLLPKPVVALKRRYRELKGIQVASLFLLFVVSILLGMGIYQKVSDVSAAALRSEKVEAALNRVAEVEIAIEERDRAYEAALPFLVRKKKTRDFLRTLAVLQEVRENHNLWFVLMADRDSYFAGSTEPLNERSSFMNRTEDILLESLPAEELGIIVELSLLDGDSDTLSPLGDVVSVLREVDFLRSVDKLTASRRQDLVNPDVTLPEKTYSLTLEMGAFGDASSEEPVLPWNRALMFTRP